MRTAVIIPAFNEEQAIGQVIWGIPVPFKSHIFVVDNGSTDRTADAARSCGAHVIPARKRGYGAACLAGVAEARKFKPDLYIFLDGDYSDYPQDMTTLVQTLVDQDLDLVIGSRTQGLAEPGSLLPQARWGNWLATALMALRYGFKFTDLGPFRAIRAEALYQLHMRDQNFGWTIEMQVKALKYGLKMGEVPVRYRRRIGKSKITGTLKGTILAAAKILWTFARYSFFPSKISTTEGEERKCRILPFERKERSL